MDPPGAKSAEALQNAGAETIVLGFLHIDRKCGVFFSEHKILRGGH